MKRPHYLALCLAPVIVAAILIVLAVVHAVWRWW
jgi:hypothetical protein